MKNKKTLLIALPIIILIVIGIFLLPKKQNNWIDNILKENYEIYTLECDGTTNILDNNTLKEIKKSWNKLSDNGPFLGDLSTCYKKVIINYNNDIADIEIIDNSSLILKDSKNTDYYTYYTNADNLITYLNSYFNE